MDSAPAPAQPWKEAKQVSCHPTPKWTMVVALGSHSDRQEVALRCDSSGGSFCWPSPPPHIFITHFGCSPALRTLTTTVLHKPAQHKDLPRAVLSAGTGCTAVMQAESTLSVLHPCSCLFSFLFKKKGKNIKISIYGLQPPQSLCPGGSLP